MYNIGVIGSGHRLTPLVKKLADFDGFEIAAVCDVDIEGVREKYTEYEGITYYTDAVKMLENEKLDCVMIGTRCSLHTQFMELCAKYSLPTFLEKPVSIDGSQLETLEKISGMDHKTVVSFPLRNTHIVNCVRDIIRSGKLGELSQIQAYNNVPYARGYYHKWYRDESETGGLWLQKATHDFDYINSLLEDVTPVSICAVESKQIFKGDMPEGLKCKDCQKRRDCPESDINVASYGDRYEIGEYCCAFAKDTGNHDSGSAIIVYDNGLHAVYTQNFVARKGAGKRGARIIGYLGTVEFDFVTGVVKVFYHNENRIETHEFEVKRGHSGGDDVLIKNFADVVLEKDVSHAPLSDGILSAKMCLMAKRSSEQKLFCKI